MSVRVEVRPSVLERARARSGVADEDWDRRCPRYETWPADAATPTLERLDRLGVEVGLSPALPAARS